MNKQKVYIIAGDRGEGKTTLTMGIIRCLQQQDVRVAGFVAQGYWKGDIRSHFELVDIESGRAVLLCTRDARDGWPLYGPFYFNPEALEAGNGIMENACLNPPGLFVADELGKFELEGLVWDRGIQRMMTAGIYPQLWTIRKHFIADLINRYGPKNIAIFEAGKTGLHQVCQEISLQIRQE